MFVQVSHAFAMFPPTRYVRGEATRQHKRDDLYRICSKLEYGKPACILWLYNAICQFYVVFPDRYFSA
jgi:hypothetical protein